MPHCALTAHHTPKCFPDFLPSVNLKLSPDKLSSEIYFLPAREQAAVQTKVHCFLSRTEVIFPYEEGLKQLGLFRLERR